MGASCCLQVLDVALRHTISGNVDVQATARAIFWRDTRVARPLGSGAEVAFFSHSEFPYPILSRDFIVLG